MNEPTQLQVVNRRDFVLGASSAAAFIGLLGMGASSAVAEITWQEAMKKAIGGATPAEGKISLTLPEIAENGNTVPFSIAIESPMTDKDYVKTVHVFATGNPRPDVGTFMFTPASGKAEMSSRMRLGKTQDVIAVAEMSDGKFYMAKRLVKVTIGGCGG